MFSHPKSNLSGSPVGSPSKIYLNWTSFLPNQNFLLEQIIAIASYPIRLLSPLSFSSQTEARVMVLKGKSHSFILCSNLELVLHPTNLPCQWYICSTTPLHSPTAEVLLELFPLPEMFFDSHIQTSLFVSKVIFSIRATSTTPHKWHPLLLSFVLLYPFFHSTLTF